MTFFVIFGTFCLWGVEWEAVFCTIKQYDLGEPLLTLFRLSKSSITFRWSKNLTVYYGFADWWVSKVNFQSLLLLPWERMFSSFTEGMSISFINGGLKRELLSPKWYIKSLKCALRSFFWTYENFTALLTFLEHQNTCQCTNQSSSAPSSGKNPL